MRRARQLHEADSVSWITSRWARVHLLHPVGLGRDKHYWMEQVREPIESR